MRNLLARIWNATKKQKFDSRVYWENRYNRGGNSGSGSYGHLAEFKAKIINSFIKTNGINTVVEFGCGDGNQLTLAEYPLYIGLDVSPTAIQKCISDFRRDKTKSFFLYSGDSFCDNHKVFECDLALSLDVLFHLVETEIYEQYLKHLFGSSSRYVIIYSSNSDMPPNRPDSHEYHRIFTKDLELLVPQWELIKVIKNEHPSISYGDESGSLADFYIYQKRYE